VVGIAITISCTDFKIHVVIAVVDYNLKRCLEIYTLYSFYKNSNYLNTIIFFKCIKILVGNYIIGFGSATIAVERNSRPRSCSNAFTWYKFNSLYLIGRSTTITVCVKSKSIYNLVASKLTWIGI
jgi:hypothetical protein